MQSPMKQKLSLVVALTAPLLLTTRLARADEPCSAYPTGTAEKVESIDLEKTFGAVPTPKKPLRFAYVTKTLINEFWQDVAVGIKSEAAKYNIQVDVQAPKDESSLVEQLNLAQTMLSKKPDALLLSPQSDSNLAPVIQAAKKLNIPTVIIDDARTEEPAVISVLTRLTSEPAPQNISTNYIRMVEKSLRSKDRRVRPTLASVFRVSPRRSKSTAT